MDAFITEMDEGEVLPRLTSRFIVRATADSTGGAYTLVETSQMPVGDGPALHVHSREDESFIVLSGRYRFFVGPHTLEGAAGAVAFAPRGQQHRFEALTADSRLLHLFVPGGIDNYFRRQWIDMSRDELQALASEYGIAFVD